MQKNTLIIGGAVVVLALIVIFVVSQSKNNTTKDAMQKTEDSSSGNLGEVIQDPSNADPYDVTSIDAGLEKEMTDFSDDLETLSDVDSSSEFDELQNVGSDL